MLKLKIILGSTRPGRAADKLMPWLLERTRGHAAFDAELHQAFDADGRPKDPLADARLGVLLDDLEWWGALLKAARPTQLPPGKLRISKAMAKKPPTS